MEQTAYREHAAKKILQLLKPLFQPDGSRMQTDAQLLDIAESLLKPPGVSVLRVNTLVGEDPKDALTIARNVVTGQDLHFHTEEEQNIPNVLLIKSIDHKGLVPHGRAVIVSPSCAQSILRGASLFASGVLAITDDRNESDKVSVWVDLEGKCTNGLRKPYEGRRLFLANGLLKMSRDHIFAGPHRPAGTAVEITEMEQRMPSFDRLPRQLFYAQNLPSILAVEELDVRPGMVVLDMCAAPGGKSSHIAAKLGNHGMLLAVDRSSKKVDTLKGTLETLQAGCVRAVVGDSSKLCSFDTPGGCLPQDYQLGKLLMHECFDRILLDPPCSGFGKRPLIVTTGFDPNLAGFAEYQRRMIKVASKLLKPGGIMVYSTCTLPPGENEGVVGYAVRDLPLALEGPKYRQYGSDGLEYGGLDGRECSLVRRFWPSGPDDSVAFFYAKLCKI